MDYSISYILLTFAIFNCCSRTNVAKISFNLILNISIKVFVGRNSTYA